MSRCVRLCGNSVETENGKWRLGTHHRSSRQTASNQTKPNQTKPRPWTRRSSSSQQNGAGPREGRRGPRTGEENLPLSGASLVFLARTQTLPQNGSAAHQKLTATRLCLDSFPCQIPLRLPWASVLAGWRAEWLAGWLADLKWRGRMQVVKKRMSCMCV